MIRKTTATLMVACLITPLASAGNILPGTTSLNILVSDGNSDLSFTANDVPYDSRGDFAWIASPLNAGTFSVNNLHINGNVDPTLGASFDLINNTNAVQTYLISINLPVAPGLLPTNNGGSTGITITDANGNGVSASDATGTSVFYTALIDGSPVGTIDLLNTPLTAGNYDSGTSTGSFGNPIPSLSGPAYSSSIGLAYELTLSPGDRAGVTGVFVSQPIPEPGSLALIALGGSMLVRQRRRH